MATGDDGRRGRHPAAAAALRRGGLRRRGGGRGGAGRALRALAAVVAAAAAAAACVRLPRPLVAWAASPPPSAAAPAAPPSSSAAAAAAAAALADGLRRRAPGGGGGQAAAAPRGRQPLRAEAKASSESGGGATAAVASRQAWLPSWVDGEVARHPVLLFTEASDAANSEAVRGLLRREAGVRFEALDIDLMGQGGEAASWAAQIREHLATSFGQTALPALFVAGKPVAAGRAAAEELAASGELRRLCSESGVEALAAPADADDGEWTNMTWNPNGRDGRWEPPRNLAGRRWYSDFARRAKFEGEHEDPARLEYVTAFSGPGSDGSSGRSRFSAAGMELLRYETNLDEPGRDGKQEKYLDFYRVHEFDYNLFSMPGMVLEKSDRTSWDRAKSLAITEEDEETYGLPVHLIRWVYQMGKWKLQKELERRQGRKTMVNVKDVQALREAMLDELRADQVYSPTRQGVAPGYVALLGGPEFEVERDADTDVPLVVALVAEDECQWRRTRKPLMKVSQSPLSSKFAKHLVDGSRRILRGARVVKVVGPQYPEIAATYGVNRYPTMLWLEPRTGRELAREVGIVTGNAMVEVTSRLKEGKLLRAPEDRPRRLLPRHSGGSPVARPTHTSSPSMWVKTKFSPGSY